MHQQTEKLLLTVATASVNGPLADFKNPYDNSAAASSGDAIKSTNKWWKLKVTTVTAVSRW